MSIDASYEVIASLVKLCESQQRIIEGGVKAASVGKQNYPGSALDEIADNAMPLTRAHFQNLAMQLQTASEDARRYKALLNSANDYSALCVDLMRDALPSLIRRHADVERNAADDNSSQAIERDNLYTLIKTMEGTCKNWIDI
jgi:hypothetical protein